MLENIDFSLTFLSFILLVCGSRAGLGQVGGKDRLNMLGFFTEFRIRLSKIIHIPL